MIGIIIAIVTVEVFLAGTVILLFLRTKKKNKISFQETLALTSLPIVTFYNNGRTLNFLLDTGASESIINERELVSCTYEETNKKRELMGIDGIARQAHVVRIPLTRGTFQYSESFQVSNMSQAFDEMKAVHGINIHGILGNTFFTMYKYILDFDDMVAYTK